MNASWYETEPELNGRRSRESRCARGGVRRVVALSPLAALLAWAVDLEGSILAAGLPIYQELGLEA